MARWTLWQVETFPTYEPAPIKIDHTCASESPLEKAVCRLYLKYQPKVSQQTILKIIKCESHGQQSARNYQAVVGVDTGVFQLNTYFHLKRAQAMGFDIYTMAGNLEYGFVLLKEQGTSPWHWSEFCWNKTT